MLYDVGSMIQWAYPLLRRHAGQRAAPLAARRLAGTRSRNCGHAASSLTRSSIMRLAKGTGLGIVLMVAACRQSPPAATEAGSGLSPSAHDGETRDASAAGGGSGRQSATAQEPSFVRITAFDCEKVYEAPGIPQAVGPITAGISIWRGGGPNGANWNAEDLRCVVGVATQCSKATIRVAIRVGTRIVADRKVDVGAPGPADVELSVPFDRWRKNLDEPLPSPGPSKLPYRTALFRATAQISCLLPTSASAADWKYPSVTADASFVAGFASGE